MYFKTGQFYMHKKMKDVCIEVCNILDATVNNALLEVRYWNLGYVGNPWLIDTARHKVFIQTQDSPDWLHLDYEKLTTVRYSDGPPK